MSTLENSSTVTTTKSGIRVTLWQVSLVILLIALAVSGYLSYLKYDTDSTVVCMSGGAFDCSTVLNSAYSEIMNVPIAYLGFGTNLVMISLLLLEKRGGSFFAANAPILFFGVVLFAFLFSVYLVYIQAAVIKAYCQWCLSHEALIFVLFGVAIFRLRNAMQR